MLGPVTLQERNVCPGVGKEAIQPIELVAPNGSRIEPLGPLVLGQVLRRATPVAEPLVGGEEDLPEQVLVHGLGCPRRPDRRRVTSLARADRGRQRGGAPRAHVSHGQARIAWRSVGFAATRCPSVILVGIGQVVILDVRDHGSQRRIAAGIDHHGAVRVAQAEAGALEQLADPGRPEESRRGRGASLGPEHRQQAARAAPQARDPTPRGNRRDGRRRHASSRRHRRGALRRRAVRVSPAPPCPALRRSASGGSRDLDRR